MIRIPDCWWRHNDLVEVLAALRDFERGCYDPKAQALAPVEWHRALRDMEIRIEIWIKRFTCGVAGRGHDDRAQAADEPAGWDEFVTRDVDRRRARATSGPDAAAGAESPTRDPSG